MGVSGQIHALNALPPRKETWYPLDRKPKVVLDAVEKKKKSLVPVRIRTPANKPVVCCYGN
jgi:hypothetical protein